MKKQKTVQIVCILDRSGSMTGSEHHVIENFNTFLDEQKALPGKAKLTLITFNSNIETVYNRVKLKDTQHITPKEYTVGGMTALNDVIGRTIEDFKDKKNVILYVHTDGFDTASVEYSATKVKALVEQQTKAGWDVNFIGAGLDALAGQGLGVQLGFSLDKITVASKSAGDFTAIYSNMSETTRNYRASVE